MAVLTPGMLLLFILFMSIVNTTESKIPKNTISQPFVSSIFMCYGGVFKHYLQNLFIGYTNGS